MGDALDHLNNRTKLEWHCGLNTDYQPKKVYRRTSIICTIGKKGKKSIGIIQELIQIRSQDQFC